MLTSTNVHGVKSIEVKDPVFYPQGKDSFFTREIVLKTETGECAFTAFSHEKEELAVKSSREKRLEKLVGLMSESVFLDETLKSACLVALNSDTMMVAPKDKDL